MEEIYAREENGSVVVIQCYYARMSCSMSAFSVPPSTLTSRISANIYTYTLYSIQDRKNYRAQFYPSRHLRRQARTCVHAPYHPSPSVQNTHTPPPIGAGGTY